MIKDLKEEILLISMEICNILSNHKDYTLVYEHVGEYILNELNKSLGDISFLSIYIMDDSGKFLKEEVVCSKNSTTQGNNLLPIYQVSQEFNDTLNILQIENGDEYYIKLLLRNADHLIGLLQIISKKQLTTGTLDVLNYLGTSISIGILQIILSNKNIESKKLLNVTIDVSRNLQPLVSIDEIISTFAHLVTKHLNFDRITLFLYDEFDKNISIKRCIDFNGNTFDLETIPKIPNLNKGPKSLDYLVGYWVPLISNTRVVGAALFDNIYSSYPISDLILEILSPLCNQFASTVENIRLFKNLQYSAQRDTLTDLYNRRFFEEQMINLDKEDFLPLSLIIGDVNGLKITNDIFGHYEGDKLLVQISKILKTVCPSKGIIARWGGDEFIILLPNTDKKQVKKICNDVYSACLSYENYKFQLSISTGYSTRITLDKTIPQIIKTAENQMYRNKLLDRDKFRSSFIDSLKKTLEKNCKETVQHLDRMHHLAESFGYHFNLTDNEICDLKLLALLHDIGKVAISKDILNKSGKLTTEEWELLKTHCEIGCRIAQSSTDLAHIANYILNHHERWDGTGYPTGKKGLDIPKLSRIIAVLDAYDVMLHGNHYKSALSFEETIGELQRESRKQFDPHIVDVFCNAILT
ncbi:MAG: diguanylate cyclase [Epulopiscium sp.]|nr:diguanylate cyclase [Candidatus Epulonipiscium sp.]